MGGMSQNPYLYQAMYDNLLGQQQPVEQEPWYARGQLGGLGRALGNMSQAALDPRVNAGSVFAQGLNDWSDQRKDDFARKQAEEEHKRALTRQELFDKIGLKQRDEARTLAGQEREAAAARGEAYSKATSEGMGSLQSQADLLRYDVENNKDLSPEEKIGWKRRIDTLLIAGPDTNVEGQRKALSQMQGELYDVMFPDVKPMKPERVDPLAPGRMTLQELSIEKARKSIEKMDEDRVRAMVESGMEQYYQLPPEEWVKKRVEIEANVRERVGKARRDSSLGANEAGLGEDSGGGPRRVDLTPSERKKALSIIQASGEISSSEWNSMSPYEQKKKMKEALGV